MSKFGSARYLRMGGVLMPGKNDYFNDEDDDDVEDEDWEYDDDSGDDDDDERS